MKNTESQIRDWLVWHLNSKDRRNQARSEVPCILGRIDVLTATELYEIKFIKHWKHALGQVLAYQTCFPTHTPHLYLIGDADKYQKRDIERVLNQFNVLITYHPTNKKV